MLYLCTGNICRSPLAERYTAHRLEQAGLAESVLVTSAGVRALEGHPMDAWAEAELVRLGGRGDGFVGRRLVAAHLEAADLVLTMTRAHKAAALGECPAALRRTFTLLEAADLAGQVAAGATPIAAPAELVADMAARKSQARLDEYDVDDPIGCPPEVHAAVAQVIAAAVDEVLAALVPLVAHTAVN
jgi:protein-tyrosine phosphatase